MIKNKRLKNKVMYYNGIFCDGNDLLVPSFFSLLRASSEIARAPRKNSRRPCLEGSRGEGDPSGPNNIWTYEDTVHSHFNVEFSWTWFDSPIKQIFFLKKNSAKS